MAALAVAGVAALAGLPFATSASYGAVWILISTPPSAMLADAALRKGGHLGRAVLIVVVLCVALGMHIAPNTPPIVEIQTGHQVTSPVTIAWAASDNVADLFRRVVIQIDGKTVVDLHDVHQGRHITPLISAGLGKHKLVIRITDSGGATAEASQEIEVTP